MEYSKIKITLQPARVKKSLKLTVAFIVAHLILSSFTVLALNDSLQAIIKGSDTADMEKNEFKALLNGVEENYSSFSIQIQPQALTFVKDYLEKEGYFLEKMKTWGKKYFVVYDEILEANGLPKELKYISVIESALNKNLISSAGAVGPWQLMADEGRRYGLSMNSIYDERTHVKKSTMVAAKLLKELYKEFGDWLLVVAAYNGGLNRVKRAIKKNNSSNFWDIQYSLPLETRNHVKKFIATHYAFEGSEGWTTLTTAETLFYKNSLTKKNTESESSITSIKKKLRNRLLANTSKIDFAKFNIENPLSSKIYSENKETAILKSSLNLFETHKTNIVLSSIHWILNDALYSLSSKDFQFLKNLK